MLARKQANPQSIEVINLDEKRYVEIYHYGIPLNNCANINKCVPQSIIGFENKRRKFEFALTCPTNIWSADTADYESFVDPNPSKYYSDHVNVLKMVFSLVEKKDYNTARLMMQRLMLHSFYVCDCKKDECPENCQKYLKLSYSTVPIKGGDTKVVSHPLSPQFICVNTQNESIYFD